MQKEVGTAQADRHLAPCRPASCCPVLPEPFLDCLVLLFSFGLAGWLTGRIQRQSVVKPGLWRTPVTPQPTQDTTSGHLKKEPHLAEAGRVVGVHD